MSRTFVLIHGTWHGGWAWRDVVACLSARGHRAHAPTLAGHGPGANYFGVAHEDCVDSVVSYLQQRGLAEVILVGHSFGGTVVQKVAERIANRIARTIFLDALILQHNQRVLDILPNVFLESLAPRDGHPQPNVSLENTTGIFPTPPWETWRYNFIQDASESLARMTWKQLSPEPSQVNLDRISLDRFYSLDIPASYIYCRQDKAMPPGYFNPGMSSLLRACNLLEMDGSHEVMFTRPAELTEKLIEAASD